MSSYLLLCETMKVILYTHNLYRNSFTSYVNFVHHMKSGHIVMHAQYLKKKTNKNKICCLLVVSMVKGHTMRAAFRLNPEGRQQQKNF